MTSPTPLIAGNWKMNGVAASLSEAQAVAAGIGATTARVAICPPATLIARAAFAVKGTALLLGGQDCRAETSGAFTGDVSAEMLTDAGASLVILGHSERRAGYGETDALVAAKVEAALGAGLEPIVCVGETLEERKAGKALEIVTGQVRGSLPAVLDGKVFSVAYEPVWAIGTGVTPTVDDVEKAHAFMRSELTGRFGAEGRKFRILYGGSVKPGNARELMGIANVDGALIGGASLKASDFLAIYGAYETLLA